VNAIVFLIGLAGVLVMSVVQSVPGIIAFGLLAVFSHVALSRP
jgi:hypothetical protein